MWPGLEAKEFIEFQVDGSERRTAEFFNSVHSGRDLGLKGKEADNSAIANSKEN